MKKKELRQALLVQNIRVDDLTTELELVNQKMEVLLKAREKMQKSNRELFDEAYINAGVSGPLKSAKKELEFANQKIAQLEKAIYEFEEELKSNK
jgi:predicted trehalose synthase